MLPLFSPAYDHMSEEEITNRWINYWNSLYPKKEEALH
jgi:hypothetical protein